MASVLYVEESSILRQTLSAALFAADHEVETLDDGLEAWASLKASSPDVLIIPIRLKGLNGVDLLTRIREQQSLRDLPVIILTDVVDRKVIQHIVTLRPAKLLVKSSFSLDTLLETIASIAEGRPVPRRAAPKPKKKPRKKPAAPAAPAPAPTVAPAAAPAAPEAEPAVSASAETPETPVEAVTPIAPPKLDLGSMVISDTGMGESVGGGQLTVRIVDERFDPSMDAAGGSTDPADTGIDSREIAPMATRVETIGAVTRRPHPELLPELCRHLDRDPGERWEPDRVEGLVSTDPWWGETICAVAAGLAGRPDPHTSITSAMQELGPRAVADLAMTAAVIAPFREGSVLRHTNLAAFIEHSIAVASLARRLATTAHGDEDRIFLASLLHDVGRLVLIDRMTDGAMNVLRTTRRCELPVEEVERRILGTDHNEIAERVLKTWRIPPLFFEPAIRHHEDEASLCGRSDSHGLVARLIALADRVCDAALLGDSGESSIRSASQLAASMNITPADLDAALDGLEERLHEQKLAFAAALGIAGTPRQATLMHPILGNSVHPLVIDDPDAVDTACRFVRSICGIGPGGSRPAATAPEPTVAVLRIRSDGEAELRARALKRIEEERGLSSRRVVAIVDDDARRGAHLALEGRTFDLVSPEAPRARYLDALRSPDESAAREAA